MVTPMSTLTIQASSQTGIYLIFPTGIFRKEVLPLVLAGLSTTDTPLIVVFISRLLSRPVGSGKTALTLALCKRLREHYNIATVTNDIFTREDQEFLIKNRALPASRILAIETGGCPHAAIREDISANLGALEILQAKYGCQLLFVESGGDNLAANYSRELADYIIYVIDVSGGDKIPRKGGPGISQSDLLLVNKIDLAPYVGASLEVMERDSKMMRGDGPTLFTSVREDRGIDDVVDLILAAWRVAGSPGTPGAVGSEN
ncbi:hypothetical protein AX14_005473 [Amanita brunnescens Koide BX004]|nr:hypothetical protein AX14_005473 [Amanita brunnescens Koide BX004]